MDKLDADLARKAADEAHKQRDYSVQSGASMVKEPPADFKVKTKKKKNVAIKTVTQTSSWRIESKEDIDTYVENLRKRLEAELEEETIINIEF